MTSVHFQQRRRGSSFREKYCDIASEWSDEDYGTNGPTNSDVFNFRRSPSLTKFGKYLLPPQSDEDAARNRLTAVFDLDETLIFARDGPLYVRPGINKLLSFLKANNVEVVVWTSSMHKYADAVISQIDEDNCISHVIYRHRSWFKSVVVANGPNKDKFSLKNLDLLGRKIDNVIIFENTPDCFMGFAENGVLVEDYYGGELEDFTLFAAVKVLRDLLAQRETAAAVGEEVPVQQFIKSCPRLHLQELQTDKGPLMGCYCLSSHDARDENRLPFPAPSPVAQKRSSSTLFVDNQPVRPSKPSRGKSKTKSMYRGMLMRREIGALKRHCETQKITSH